MLNAFFEVGPLGNEFLIFYQPWILFVWGACWGSFLNVVMYRYPLGRSVVEPASACPSCHKPIAAYDNIPVLSWLILRGRCRNCKASFSPMYAVNEAAFGLVCAIPVIIFSEEWIKGVSLGMGALALIPAVWMQVRHGKAPIWLWLGALLFGGLHASQFLL